MTKARSLLVVASALLFVFAGCDQSARLERRSPQDVALVKSWFELLRSGHADQVEDLMDPSLRDTMSRGTFEELVATIPLEAPSSVKPIFVDMRCEEGTCQEGIVLEYRYSTELLVFNTALQKESGQISLVGIHISLIPDSVVKANKFTLSNKGLSQYLILILAIVVPLFSLYVLVLCIRARIGPWKWLWAAFILIGFTKLAVNWTTGELDFDFRAIQVLSADVYPVQYGPWVISFSVPLGAVLFMVRYRKTLFPARSEKPRSDQVRN